MARTSETARLTKRSVDSATPWVDDHGKIRQKLYFDRDMKGFGLCVGAKSKTFFAQREVRGRQVRVTIGRYGIFTADEARTEARQLLARMAKGENPNETKRAERARSVTFRDALELYLAQPTGRGGTPRSVKTLQDYRSSAERYLKDWLDQPLADIKRRDVYDKHRKIASDISDGSGRFSGGGTYAANGAMRMFRAVYNRATRQHEDLPANPCVNIDWFPEFRREAAVPYAELHRWYTDVMEIRSPIRRDYLCFVLFTGLRKQNAAEVRWEHVDFEARTLLVPKPKSRRPFSLPLSDFLVGLLEARRDENEQFFPECPWVFPAHSRSGHIAEPKAELSVPFSIHGLRNTFITAAESLDISPYAIKLLVNHSLPRSDVTAGYIQVEVDRLREPMQRITNRLRKLTEPPASVTTIAAAKRSRPV